MDQANDICSTFSGARSKTAEKLFSLRDFSKEEMDQWAKSSHHLAVKAQREGFFDGEILPIEAEQADGLMMTVQKEQSVRENVSFERLAQLKPAYKENGVITAGSSSPLNAPASSILLMSKEKAREKGIQPLATIRSIGFAGVDPTIMGFGPVPAINRGLENAGLKVEDIDYCEINEAFTIVVLNA